MARKSEPDLDAANGCSIVFFCAFVTAAFFVDDFGSLLAGALIGTIGGAVVTALIINAADDDVALDRIEQDSKSPRRRLTPKRLSKKKAKPLSLWESGNWPPPDHAIDDGGGLSFTYADENGEVTDRRIIDWKEDPEYDHCFNGWCTLREEPRTFRIDRVQSWG